MSVLCNILYKYIVLLSIYKGLRLRSNYIGILELYLIEKRTIDY